jgi:hypothetical protein
LDNQQVSQKNKYEFKIIMNKLNSKQAKSLVNSIKLRYPKTYDKLGK